MDRYPKFEANFTQESQKSLLSQLPGILAQCPDLQLDLDGTKRGSETYMVPAALGGKKLALRVGGTGAREVRGYTALSGVEGVPQMHQVFMDEYERPIALLVDYIDGIKLSDYIATSTLPDILKLERRLLKLVRDVHAKGCLMPDDWGKEGNVIVSDQKPFLVDIGAHRRSRGDAKQDGYQRSNDIGEIASLLADRELSIRGVTRRLIVLLGILPSSLRW